MRESMNAFVRSEGNSLAVEAMDSLNELPHGIINLFITGPKGAGKSALVRSWTEDAIRNGGTEKAFACSGADIAMALQFEADDSFFERLGSVPVLVIDDLEPLIRTEKGDQLLSLMLAERERQLFSTVVTSRKPLEDYELADSDKAMQAFKIIQIEPLDESGLKEFVRLAFAEYATKASPTLSDDAVERIVALMKGDFTNIEHAAHYLATDEDCAKLGTINAKTVDELLIFE